MYGFLSEALEMTNKSRVIYVGQHKRPVTMTGLLPEEYLAVATAVAKMSETLDSELGRAPDRWRLALDGRHRSDCNASLPHPLRRRGKGWRKINPGQVSWRCD
jgi:hypothetical protein